MQSGCRGIWWNTATYEGGAHGSKTSSTPALLDSVHPRFRDHSAGFENPKDIRTRTFWANGDADRRCCGTDMLA